MFVLSLFLLWTGAYGLRSLNCNHKQNFFGKFLTHCLLCVGYWCTMLNVTDIKLEEIFFPNILCSSSANVPFQHKYLLAYRTWSQWCQSSLKFWHFLDQICMDRMGLSDYIRASGTDFIWPLHVKMVLITFIYALS